MKTYWEETRYSNSLKYSMLRFLNVFIVKFKEALYR